MNYLSKIPDSQIVLEGWTYATRSHRLNIRSTLIQEQSGFCAYTEDFITPMYAVDIEHFDDTLKNTENDDYWNWYAVGHKLNLKKPSIVGYLPIMKPYGSDLKLRIFYADGEFQVFDEDDIEAKNLIAFLGWNDPILVEYRAKTVEHLKFVRDQMFNSEDEFVSYLRSRPENLRFITVLRVELGIDL